MCRKKGHEGIEITINSFFSSLFYNFVISFGIFIKGNNKSEWFWINIRILWSNLLIIYNNLFCCHYTNIYYNLKTYFFGGQYSMTWTQVTTKKIEDKLIHVVFSYFTIFTYLYITVSSLWYYRPSSHVSYGICFNVSWARECTNCLMYSFPVIPTVCHRLS